MLMPFGKYRGCPVDDLPENYLQWLADNCDLREPLASAVEDALYLAGCYTPATMPDQDVMKGIYRQMAFKYHPDRGGSTEAMQAINEFYERLRSYDASI